jgi:hypothetical protein
MPENAEKGGLAWEEGAAGSPRPRPTEAGRRRDPRCPRQEWGGRECAAAARTTTDHSRSRARVTSTDAGEGGEGGNVGGGELRAPPGGGANTSHGGGGGDGFSAACGLV